jgi:transcriptional regulator with XRE-family HTH domain
MTPAPFHDLFAAALKEKGLTYAGFARTLNRPRQTIRRWALGIDRPRFADVETIARALGRPSSYFLPSEHAAPPVLVVRIGQREVFRTAVTEAVSVVVIP